MVGDAGSFPFVPVEGTGVYEIPVGPVHAGLIEPGHFRFWVVGETILRMKARLWFVHKGIERLFEGKDVASGLEIAERISGDTAVGHGLAYCQAVEDALGTEVPEDAQILRSVLLELERLYNHVADIGALCNDVGFGLAQAWALSLREQLLRLESSGHRSPTAAGRRRSRRRPGPPAALRGRACRDRSTLRGAGRPDRVERTRHGAIHRHGDARRVPCQDLGVVGVVGRASGLSFDARIAHPLCRSWGRLLAGGAIGRRRDGPLLRSGWTRSGHRCRSSRASSPTARPLDAVTWLPARWRITNHPTEGWGSSRAGEAPSSTGSSSTRTGDWPGSRWSTPRSSTGPPCRCALTDTIVPDFPLANKSFNLSYAGNDL